MKTLRTLQQMVEAAPPRHIVRLPNPAALRRSGAAVVESKITNDQSKLLVYENGYVTYDNGSRHTVFPLHDIHGDYYYHPYSGIIRPDMIICEDEILSMPWFMGTLMVAEDRIVHSQDNSEINKKVYPAGLVPEHLFGLVDPSPDVLYQIIQQQELLDAIQMVDHALSTITEDQRRVVIECFQSEEKRKDIAKRLNMSPQLLNYFLKSGLRGMHKTLKIDETK